jgi:hypothetical protein
MLDTMTLTEFLLWRIAVDEDRHAFRDLAEVFRARGEGLVADFLDKEEARALAECEAKRRIVSVLDAVLAQSRNHEQRQNAETTLRHLAAVYSDHPDYREEWRP